MYFRRKVDSYLRQWKDKENRLPLIIKGARQIGKTESIVHFASENYENIVFINFVLEGQYKTILSDGYSVENIIKNISLIDPSKKFIAGKTLIVFDGLQEFPDIATSLKAFKLDGRFDVICSGSLLGINYKKIHSNSVGYKTDYEMFSMDFEEFAEYFKLNDESEMVSVSGWVMEQFGRVPEQGDQLTYKGLEIEVTKVDNHHVDEIRVKQTVVEDEETSEEK